MMLHLGYRGCDALTNALCKPLQLLGRLAPGRTLAEAEAELNLLARQLAATFPTEQGRVISLRPALGVRMIEREAYAYHMQLLMTVTGLLILIDCCKVDVMVVVHGAAQRYGLVVVLE